MGAGTVQGTCLLQKQAMLWICHWHFHSAMTARTEPDWLTIHCCSKHFLPSMRIKRAAFCKNEQSFNLSGATMGQFVVQRISHPGLRSCCQTLVQLAVSKQVWSAGKTWLVQFKQPSTREQYFHTVKAPNCGSSSNSNIFVPSLALELWTYCDFDGVHVKTPCSSTVLLCTVL